MPLTAYDPATGNIIRPGSTVATPQCRDPKCRADLHPVRQTDQRVAHFRHSVHSDCPNHDPIREREAKTEWHIWWQMQCDTPERIEYSHVDASGDRRRADILTPFDWCIEVQHSPISPKTISARENHWGGRVLWLVDAVSDDRGTDLDAGGKDLRLTGTWVHHMTTLIAVDDGVDVWGMPTRVSRMSGEISAPIADCTRMSRAEFIDRWVNATSAPFATEPRTRWRWDAVRRQQEARASRHEREAMAAARAAREVATKYVCEYEGPTHRLIYSDPVVEPEAPLTLVSTVPKAPPERAAPVQAVEKPPWPLAAELTDIGPCAACQTLVVRYGPFGRPLCLICEERLNREETQ